METAHWKGELLFAGEVGAAYAAEKEVRKASGRKELRCPDPACAGVVRYCHGDKKAPYFAHLDNVSCDYAAFDKKDTSAMRNARMALYRHFKEQGHSVAPEKKVLARHYTHLFFETETGPLALELGTQRTSANEVDFLAASYREKGIASHWLVLGDPNAPVREDRSFFLKRFSLNESAFPQVMVLSWDAAFLSQHRLDTQKYELEGNPVNTGWPEQYSEYAPLAALCLSDGQFCLRGFQERFLAWQEKKQANFAEKCTQILAAEAERLREQAGWQAQLKNPDYFKEEPELPPSAPPIQKNCITCVLCGLVTGKEHFAVYGGEYGDNFGKCRGCMRG